MTPAERLRELHERLLARDPTAPPEIASLLLDELCQSLRRAKPYCPSEYLLDQAAEDALISYFKRPEQYDPAKGELAAYLRMSALGDLKNLLRREKNFREKFQTGVELSQVSGKETTDEACSRSSEEAEELRGKLRELFPDQRDWQMAVLIIEEERRTEPFAEILEIDHLPWEEQRREVKRHKDRIKQKLRRYGDSIRDQHKPD